MNLMPKFKGTLKDDIINGQAGNDTLLGNQGNDKLSGRNGWDLLHGNAGNDTLLGNQGSDVLVGDNGRDILTGGSGSDVFFLVPETNKAAQADRITDFNKATDFIVLGNNLTAEQLKLEKIKAGTLIKAKKTGKILGIVENVKPSDLEYSFISGNVPNDLGKLVTFGEPIAKTLANGNVKLELKGTDGGKFITTLSEKTGIQQIRYLAGSSSNIKDSFTVDLNGKGSQIKLKIDGDKNEWEIKIKNNDEIDVALNGKVFMTLPANPKNDDGGSGDPIDPLDPCGVFKQICETVKQINSVLSWIPPLPALAPLTAVQMGLEFTEYACLLVLGDDKDLAETIASKTLSFLGEKAGDTILNFYRKQNKLGDFLEKNELLINPEVFNQLKKTQEQNPKTLGQFLGNVSNQSPVKNFTTDLSSSIINYINTKLPNNLGGSRSSSGIMTSLRKALGIDWCDEDSPPAKPNIKITGPKTIEALKNGTFTVSWYNPDKNASAVQITGFGGLTIGGEMVAIPEDKREQGSFQFKARNQDFFGSYDSETTFEASLYTSSSWIWGSSVMASDPDVTVKLLGAGDGIGNIPAQAIPVDDKNGNFWVKWL
jgi:hypothetical protein